MATVLRKILDFLRRLRVTRGFIHQSFRRWALVLAFLGRRLGVWCPGNHGKWGTFRKAEQTERLFPGTGPGAHLHSMEYVIAASYAPASASHPSLQAASITPPAPTNLTAEPHQDHAYLASVFDTRIRRNRSSANLSGHSRASDRLSIARTYSRESLHAPASHPTRFPKAPHRQFGSGPSPSPSRERPSRSPSPTNRVRHPLPHLEIDITNLRPQTHVDGRHSPVTPPSVASHAHAPLSPPSLHGHRTGRRQSSTSMVVGVVNPSTDSLSLSPSVDRLPRALTEEPYTIGPSTTGNSSPVSDALDARAGSLQYGPTASSLSTASNLDLPKDHILQLIHSEQVPRYTKDATLQVNFYYDYHCIKSFCSHRPRERTHYEIPRLTTTFLQYV
jgi:hypothetical protein